MSAFILQKNIMTHNIIYLFDPLCGWCYGASAGLETLAADPANQIRLLPSGLFSQTGRIMDAEMSAFAWRNDQKIAGLTGAVFSEAYRRDVLNAKGGAFDSYIIIQALTAVVQTAPQREIETLKAFQKARYIEGANIVSQQEAAAVLTALGLTEAAALLDKPELIADADARIAEGKATAARHGITGVLALLYAAEQGWQQIDSSILFRHSGN